MTNNKNYIIQSVSCYLRITENWIYGQIINLSRYKPIIVTQQMVNCDVFPFTPIYSTTNLSKFKQWTQTISAKLFGTYLNYFEDIIKQKKPVFIHAHFGNEGCRNIRLKLRHNIPLITTFYGIDMSYFIKTRRWKYRYQRLFTEGDLFLVEGSYMKQCLVDLGCPDRKVVVQHIGVNTEKIPYSPRKLTNGNKIRVLVAARFVEKKGIPYAIRAFAKVKTKYKHLELILIGDGEIRPEIERLIVDLDLSECVRLLGLQPYSVFLSELKKSHILLQPSVTSKSGETEGGAPVSLIEAQASGVPILSTYHADIPEVVLDSKTGFLVPERNVNALSERLEYLVKHPEIWDEMGKSGRKHVEKEFNIKRQVRKLESIYDQFVQGKLD